MSAPAGTYSHVVTRSGVEYRVTGAEYLGAHASATNGPLWRVDADRLDDEGRAYWHESTAPVIGLRPCDTADPCPSARAGVGCYLHEIRAEPRVCFCPDDCSCHYAWRLTVCGCRGHEN